MEEEKQEHTSYKDIVLYPFPFLIGIWIFRYILERYCFKKIGFLFGLKEVKAKKAVPNQILENVYSSTKKWSHKEIAGLAKQLDWTERRIQTWLRFRNLQEKPSSLSKFSENCWRLFYFTNMFGYGLSIIWDKDWFWDLDNCWKQYPEHDYTHDIWTFYMITLAFYWSILFGRLSSDKKINLLRPSFYWNMITLVTLSSSWYYSFYRICTVLLTMEYVANAFAEAWAAIKYKKLNHSIKYAILNATVVTLFAQSIWYFVWFLDSVIYGNFVTLPKELFFVPYALNGFLFVNFCYKIRWMIMVLRIIWETLSSEKMKATETTSTTDAYSS